MIELNPSGINEELRRSNRWVLWLLCDVFDNGKLRKDAKVPFNARTGQPASHSDPATWSEYEVALDAHNKKLALHPPDNIVKSHDTRGIGLVIGPPFFGIDIDDCRNPETGEIEAWAVEFLRELNSYTEVSPSGTGVHVWLHGEAPYKEGHRKDGIEIYSCNRYLTVTGIEVEL
jgi:putative DNA primase/helicase